MYLSFGENSLTLTKENEIVTSLEITFEDLQIVLVCPRRGK